MVFWGGDGSVESHTLPIQSHKIEYRITFVCVLDKSVNLFVSCLKQSRKKERHGREEAFLVFVVVSDIGWSHDNNRIQLMVMYSAFNTITGLHLRKGKKELEAMQSAALFISFYARNTGSFSCPPCSSTKNSIQQNEEGNKKVDSLGKHHVITKSGFSDCLVVFVRILSEYVLPLIQIVYERTKLYFRTKMIDAKGKWFWGYVTYFFLGILWSYGLDILKYKKQRIQHCIWWPKVEKANSAWNCTLSHKDHRKEKKEAVERRTFNILRAVLCSLLLLRGFCSVTAN